MNHQERDYLDSVIVERDDYKERPNQAYAEVQGWSDLYNESTSVKERLKLKAEVARLREAVLLLNGMVTCGEGHSEQSTAVVVAALAKEDA